jgi:hypothetical protein
MAQGKRTLIFLIIATIFLLLLAVVLAYFSFLNKENNYVIQNKYYGFSLQTPKSWRAEENTNYPENAIAKILDDCQNDKSENASTYQIGAFRFFYGTASLRVDVSCVPGGAKNVENYGSTKIGGEKTAEGIASGPDESDSVKYFSFSHNGFEYKISQLGYSQVFNKIISSFNFIK